MDPVLRVALAFGLFAATHLGIASSPLRRVLVARFGPWGFTVLFSLVAWLTFGVAVSSYVAHAGEGPAGLALGRIPALRALLVACIVLGAMLMTGTFGGYARSPFAVGGGRARAPPPRPPGRRGRPRIFRGGGARRGGARAAPAPPRRRRRDGQPRRVRAGRSLAPGS